MITQNFTSYNIVIFRHNTISIIQDYLYVLQLLDKIITDAMNYASQKGFSSVALPAMGTGNLQFSRDVVAEMMFNSMIEFSKKNPGTSVKDVRFVLYDKDQSTIDVS